ncbi:MAG: hypothetical protein MMC33_005545 [Icmadophila ericetorum]|nr:hypothetical protein [Icmadophila ericetorum]
MAEKRVRCVGIRRKIPIARFKKTHDEGDWDESKEAGTLKEKSEVMQIEFDLIKRQSEKPKENPSDADFQEMQTGQAFVQMYLTHVKGLGLKTAGGDRDGSVQGQFRSALIKENDTANPDPLRETLWCPIMKAYVHSTNATATGKQRPRAQFPMNGLLVGTPAEQRFDKGRFVLVPAIAANVSPKEIQEWRDSAARKCIIRMVNREAKDMQLIIGADTQSTKTWLELDGEEFNVAIALEPKKGNLPAQRTWKTSLGSPVKVPALMLKAFVIRKGHEFKNYIPPNGAISQEEPDDTALGAAAIQISNSITKREDNDENELGEDQDDDESEVSFETN